MCDISNQVDAYEMADFVKELPDRKAV